MAAVMDTTPAPRAGWRIVTGVLVLAVFAEAAFAGAMLSGVEWARRAHMMSAGGLIVFALAAGLIALVALRRVINGRKLALMLLALAAILVAQAFAGVLSAKGANLMWLHVPLGVALVGLAGQAAASARSLGGPT